MSAAQDLITRYGEAVRGAAHERAEGLGSKAADQEEAAAKEALSDCMKELVVALRKLADRTLAYVGPTEDPALECDEEMRKLATAAQAAVARAVGLL